MGARPTFATAFRDRFLFARRAAVRNILDRSLARGEIATGTDLELLIDVVYGVLWYRLLLDQMPLNAAAGRQLAALVMRVVAPASPSVERPPPNDS